MTFFSSEIRKDIIEAYNPVINAMNRVFRQQGIRAPWIFSPGPDGDVTNLFALNWGGNRELYRGRMKPNSLRFLAFEEVIHAFPVIKDLNSDTLESIGVPENIAQTLFQHKAWEQGIIQVFSVNGTADDYKGRDELLAN